jgi:hypothetical protein
VFGPSGLSSDESRREKLANPFGDVNVTGRHVLPLEALQRAGIDASKD